MAVFMKTYAIVKAVVSLRDKGFSTHVRKGNFIPLCIHMHASGYCLIIHSQYALFSSLGTYEYNQIDISQT